MSDNWITLIPEDPRFVPDAQRRDLARERFIQIVPAADRVEITVGDTIEFFDCGENFQRVLCPSCRCEIPINWWQDRMDDDYGDGTNGFELAKYQTPCCGDWCTLHELNYEWNQGFGRFALSAMNPNIARLDDARKQELEAILQAPLRLLYVHC